MSARERSTEWRRARRDRNDFSADVRAHVRARDQERCVLCGRPGREVHHIIPRMEGGLGTPDNGVCLDPACHHLAHRKKSTVQQLVRYRERVLLPFYGLADPTEFVWLDPLAEGRCPCGGEVTDDRCANDCGLVVWKGEEIG